MRIASVLKKLPYRLLQFTTIILCLLAILLSTSLGTRLTLAAANQLTFLSLDYQSGTLLNDLNLAHLNIQIGQLKSSQIKAEQFDPAQLKIELENVAINFNLACLFKGTLCIEDINGEKFYLRFTAQTKSNSAQTIENKEQLTAGENPPELINIPFAFQFDQLSFTEVEVLIDDIVEVKVEDLFSELYLNEALVKVSKPSASVAKVNILSRTNKSMKLHKNSPEETKSTKYNWPLTKLKQIHLPLNLVIEQLAVHSSQLSFTDSRYLLKQITTSGRWFQTHLDIAQAQFSLAPLNFAQKSEAVTAEIPAQLLESLPKISLQGSSELATPFPLNLSANIDLKQFSPWPALAKSQHNISLNGSLKKLTAAINTQGSWRAVTNISTDLLNQPLPFKIAINVSQWPQTPSLSADIIATEIKLAANGDLTQQSFNGTAIFSGLGYQNAKLKLAGEHQQGQLKIDQFSFNDNHSDSQLQAHGIINFAQQLAWKIQLSSSGLTLPENTSARMTPLLGKMSGRVSGKLASQGQLAQSLLTKRQKNQQQEQQINRPWFIELSDTHIQGDINEVPFSLMADAKLDHLLNLSPSQLTFSALNNQFTFQGYSDEQWQVQGSLLSQDLSQLARLSKLVPIASLTAAIAELNLKGEQETLFIISGERASPKLSLHSKSNHINISDFAIDDADIEVEYRPFSDHKGKLLLTSEKIHYQLQQFEQFSAELSGDINRQQMALSWQGKLATDLTLTSTWQAENKQLSLLLTNALVAYQNYQFTADNNIAAQYYSQDEKLIIAPHCWLNQYIEFCSEKRMTIGLSADIALKAKIDSELFNQAFMPSDSQITTNILGEIKANWLADEKPTLSANFAIDAGEITYFAPQPITLSQWQQGRLYSQLINNTLTTQLSLVKANNQPLIKIKNQLNLTGDKKISGSVIINQFNLKPFQALSSDLSQLNASLSSDLTLHGQLNQPVIHGHLAIDDGQLSFNRTSSEITDFSLKANINNQSADISGKFFLDAQPAEYNAALDWQQQLVINAALSADQLSFIFPPSANVSLAPNLTAHYQNNLLHIAGQINVLKGLLTLTQFPEGSVNISDDVIMVDDHGQALSQKKSLMITTDVDIHIDNTFKLAGLGFSGNLGGNLKVLQAKAQPMQLYGNLGVLNGYYQAYGQNLLVKQGKMTFNGPMTNPYVDFRAERYIKKDDVNVGLTVNGLANAIELQLYSQPTMAQPEVLSYLIRGQGLDSGTSNNTAAIGIALGTTLTKAENLNRLIQKLPLLHDISIDTEVDGEQAQATISGYLGDRIYLKYGVGIYDPIDEITVRLYLLNRLWLETVAGLEKSADLYYSFDVE